MRWTLPLLLALAPLAAVQAAPRPGLSITLLSGGSTNTTSYDSNGSDWGRAQALRQGNRPLLYVRQGGTAYVIRDPAVIAQAEAILKPQQDLGARQGELGRQQSALGAEQARLGGQMARGVRRGETVAAKMSELGRQQAALGRRQAALGSRQSALGQQQSRLADLARPKFEALVADALRRGVAQRVD